MILSNRSIVLGLKPLDGIWLCNSVRSTNFGCASLTAGNTLTWAGPARTTPVRPTQTVQGQNRNLHDAVEVHSVYTNGRVIFDSQIDMLGDTKAKVTSLGEIFLLQLVLFDLEPPLENFLCLRATDGDMNSDLFISVYRNCSKGVEGSANILATGFSTILFRFREARKVKKSTEPKRRASFTFLYRRYAL